MTKRPHQVRVAVAGAIAATAIGGALPAYAGPTGTLADGAAALPAGCSGGAPVVCQLDVAPGNYTVTATLGDPQAAGSTGLTVEARRRILAPVSTAAGALRTVSATVNVRVPEGQPTGQGGVGSAGLTLRFDGGAPRLASLTVTRAASPSVAYLAGDSTVCDQPAAPYTGWGQILPSFLAAGAVVANYADSGESSGSFLSNRALNPTMQPLIRGGDLVFIQFGHNDKSTTAAAFRANLTTLVTGVRSRGGVPVLVTPPVRRLFSGPQLTPTALHVNGVGVNLPAEMKRVAAASAVPLIDLTARSEALVESLGPAASSRLFLTRATDGVADNTHFSEYGATRMATLVAEDVRGLGLPLASFLR